MNWIHLGLLAALLLTPSSHTTTPVEDVDESEHIGDMLGVAEIISDYLSSGEEEAQICQAAKAVPPIAYVKMVEKSRRRRKTTDDLNADQLCALLQELKDKQSEAEESGEDDEDSESSFSACFDSPNQTPELTKDEAEPEEKK